ncbi:hypothetical protein PRIC2_010858 [Phytophthora ramorum]
MTSPPRQDACGSRNARCARRGAISCRAGQLFQICSFISLAFWSLTDRKRLDILGVNEMVIRGGGCNAASALNCRQARLKACGAALFELSWRRKERSRLEVRRDAALRGVSAAVTVTVSVADKNCRSMVYK